MPRKRKAEEPEKPKRYKGHWTQHPKAREILTDAMCKAIQATRCPTCGILVADVFQHVDGCRDFEPHIRPQYPPARDAKAKIDSQGRVWAEGKLVSEHRRRVCLNVLKERCKCGRCVPCQIGRAVKQLNSNERH